MVSFSIIESCKKQDRIAHKALYESCISYVYSIVSRYLSGEEDRKDVVQEVFAKTFKSLDHFDQKKGEFKFWIRKITVNQCLMQIRSQSKLKVYSINEHFDVVDSTDLGLESLTREDILKLLDEMPERYKLVFMAYIIDGYNHKEIGELLGITKDTSRSQLTRAKKWIRNHISKGNKISTYGLF